LKKEIAELKRVNEVLRAASAYFAAEIDPTRRRS
jgi:transposase